MDAFKRILNQSIFVFIYDAINFSVKFKVTWNCQNQFDWYMETKLKNSIEEENK